MNNVLAPSVDGTNEVGDVKLPQKKLFHFYTQRSVDTACLGCRFARGHLNERKSDKQLQFIQDEYGCHMDVINKMLAKDVEVQDCEDANGNEFHVLMGRVCPFYRTKAWRKDLLDDHCAAVVQVRKEVTLKPDVVVYFDDNMKPADILTTARALKRGKICPKKLFVINNSNLKPSQLMSTLHQCPIPWRMETVIEGEGTPMLRALDIMTKKCNGIFVTYFVAGHTPDPKFFTNIDSALYDDFDKFVVLHNEDQDDINGLTVLNIFYKQVGGNARKSIVDKALKISEDQECQSLVRPLKQVCPQ